jgi:hypothetical protein
MKQMTLSFTQTYLAIKVFKMLTLKAQLRRSSREVTNSIKKRWFRWYTYLFFTHVVLFLIGYSDNLPEYVRGALAYRALPCRRPR